ncbi:MAG: zinc ribbon domain-containing protein [Thermoplasmata archaeon]
MSSKEGVGKKTPDHCPLCGSDITPDDAKCPKCNVNISWVLSQMDGKFVERVSHRTSYPSVISDDGEELRKEIEHDKMVDCTACGSSNPISEKFCQNCGKSIEEIIHNEALEDMLMNVDDETFEIKGMDTESIVNNIRQFASLLDKSKENYHIEFSYTCPLCKVEVEEDSDICHGCGALFED